jgi:transposase
MALAEAHGLPVAASVASATPHEVNLVQPTLEQRFVEQTPQRLIGDGAYDSDRLDVEMKQQGIEVIAPHRHNRRRAPTQDGRALRRYVRRWKIERLWAWLQNYRRIVVRYEYHAANYLGFVLLGCLLILLKRSL